MSGSQNTSFNARNVHKAQRRVDDQRVRLHSMIVRGFPTQSAEDLLCRHYVTLRHYLMPIEMQATGPTCLPVIACASSAWVRCPATRLAREMVILESTLRAAATAVAIASS